MTQREGSANDHAEPTTSQDRYRRLRSRTLGGRSEEGGCCRACGADANRLDHGGRCDQCIAGKIAKSFARGFYGAESATLGRRDPDELVADFDVSEWGVGWQWLVNPDGDATSAPESLTLSRRDPSEHDDVAERIAADAGIDAPACEVLGTLDAAMAAGELVADDDACPGCGERDRDRLVWIADGSGVICDECGTAYIPGKLPHSGGRGSGALPRHPDDHIARDSGGC